MAEIKPLHYLIHLEPDLKSFRFNGKAVIHLEASEPVNEISLDALELAVWNCTLDGEKKELPCVFSMDPSREKLTVSLPEKKGGAITLRIEYVGVINDKLAGFYRTRYLHSGVERFAAVTQFEENDARRAFPCFDHPARKATFDVKMVIEEGLSAISNCPVEEETPLDHGRKLVRFRRTPIMSTYLLFFAAGEFEFLEDRGEVLIRLIAAPGMTGLGDFALAFSRKALLFSEGYYGIPYPLPKLDLIAVSDFAAGAMENWGAMTFRENLLLRDPQKTSRAGEQRICEVIAHEIAHQWFGDLVTPREWEYLWLNESFATYFGFGVVDHYYPEWDLWSQFLHNTTNVALERDGLQETLSIEIPGGGHVVINVSTAPIIYSKGGSILRQVEGYVGSEGFREGLRRYLRKHAYGTATSDDLWQSFEEASAKPVSRMIRSWVAQPGYPILGVSRLGDQLRIRQERFSFIPMESAQEWMIPVSVKLFLKGGGTRSVNVLLEGRSSELPLGEDVEAYLVNEGAAGFYRVRYEDEGNLLELGRRVASKTLLPQERWSIQNDLYSLVKRGEMEIESYLAYLEWYADEESYLPLVSIGDHLHHAFMIFEGRAGRLAASTGGVLFEKALSRIGYEPAGDESQAVSIMREQLLWNAAIFGSEKAARFGREQFASLCDGKGVHPDLMRSVMQIGALHGKGETFDWLEKTLAASGNEHERLNILAAMGCFREESVVERALHYALESVPDRNKFVLIGTLAANPCAFPRLWNWYLSSLPRLEKLHPVHYERVIAAIVPWSGLGREEEVRRFFEEYMKNRERSRDVIRLSLERMEIHSRMRRRIVEGA
jgi:aminopeptidase N